MYKKLTKRGWTVTIGQIDGEFTAKKDLTISEQDKISFESMYNGAIKPETSTKILNFCDKNDTDINSCLSKLKAQPSQQKSAQKQMGRFCCVNVSNQWGEYAYIHGQDYCIYPCAG